jgi:hypothetical protein
METKDSILSKSMRNKRTIKHFFSDEGPVGVLCRVVSNNSTRDAQQVKCSRCLDLLSARGIKQACS